MAALLKQPFNPTLPAWKHFPGQSESADHAPLDAMKALVPARFLSYVPLKHAAFQYGLLLHDNSFFWEAHEVWEAVWLAAPQNGRDRLVLRALIQTANAGMKASLSKVNACNRLISEAVTLLCELEIRVHKNPVFSPADRLKSQILIADLMHWKESPKNMHGRELPSLSRIQLSTYFRE